MKRMLILAGLIVIWLASGALAQSEGRYRAVALPKAGVNENTRVFIVDTREGHMWLWTSSPVVSYLPQEGGKVAVTEYLTYQGRLRPGEKMGDLIDSTSKRK